MSDKFVGTDLTTDLTLQIFKKLVSDYQKQTEVNRAEKKAKLALTEKKQLSLSDFLQNKYKTNDSTKDLAQQIYNLIKPHL